MINRRFMVVPDRHHIRRKDFVTGILKLSNEPGEKRRVVIHHDYASGHVIFPRGASVTAQKQDHTGRATTRSCTVY
jgi:hypothetical protein